jgi:hypothetical protein
MSGSLRILIVGGYGIFGGRIIELLEDEPRLTMIVAGRSLASASAFCGTRRHARAELIPATFDRDGDVAAQMSSLAPDLIVDASGPFQAYREGQYSIIQACLKLRVPYLDLADGSDFVAGVDGFNEQAIAAGIYVLSGVSTFPVLTAAVIRHLSVNMVRVDDIRGGIAPSPFARVGANVIRAIASYAGRSVRVRRDGKVASGRPFTEQLRFTVSPPGHVPLRSTLFSLVDVPDHVALPQLWPDVRTVWMGAGPVPELLHRALIAFAWLVRLGLIPSLSTLAPLMHAATSSLRWGEHRGGMFVTVEGVDSLGATVSRSWHLLAEGDDGPLIPSMAVEAIVRNVLAGRAPVPGARAAVRDLELADYEQLFSRRAIQTGTRDEQSSQEHPLYRRILGAAWEKLPAEIRALHDLNGPAIVSGRASVVRGKGILARAAAAWIGFPRTLAETPVQVRFDVQAGVETWTRTLGANTISSRQFAGTGRSERLLCERFGPLTLAMALVPDGQRLQLVLRRWSMGGVPLPLWLGPRIEAFESVEEGRFRFHVRISHPLTGLIVKYAGWLAPAAQE